MSNATILLSSVTWAIRAQKMLEQRGIRSYMKKISGAKSGCGYGLRINGDTDTAIKLLEADGVRIKEVLS